MALIKNLVFVLLLTTLSSQNSLVSRCLRWNTSANTCYVCFRSKPNATGCGPLLPESDTCLYYKGKGTPESAHCKACKPGYASTEDGTCVSLNIPNCARGRVSPDSTGKLVKSCMYCQKGLYATANGSSCVAAPSGKGVPNCLWGYMPGGPYDLYMCQRCASGYALSDGEEPKCVKTTSETAGCWLLSSKKSCSECDAFEGWSAQSDGKCQLIKKE